MEKKNLYLVSLRVDEAGRMENFAIVAKTRDDAEKEAYRLAGLNEEKEPHTTQTLHRVDSVV